jgi:hypothetical protein
MSSSSSRRFAAIPKAVEAQRPPTRRYLLIVKNLLLQGEQFDAPRNHADDVVPQGLPPPAQSTPIWAQYDSQV